jgi:hypothetical protein
VTLDVSTDERDLLLAALFHLRIDHAEDNEKGAEIEALVAKLGGDPEAVFFGGYADTLGSVPLYPTI